MSDERAVIAGKFQRARYVISIKARSHNYTARRGSPCRNTTANIFQFCAQLGKKNHERGEKARTGERERPFRSGEGGREGGRKSARRFLLSLQKTYSLPVYTSANTFRFFPCTPTPPLSLSLFYLSLSLVFLYFPFLETTS